MGNTVNFINLYKWSMRNQSRRRQKFKASARRLVVQSSFPKSASQYLRHLLLESFNEQYVAYNFKLSSGFGNSFINAPMFSQCLDTGKNCYVNGHLPMLEHNVSLLEESSENLHYIVTIRPLPDVIVSYADHVQSSGKGALDYNTPGLVEAHPNWKGLTEAQKYSYLISMVVPWYIRFLASFLFCDCRSLIDFVTFEEIVNCPEATSRRLVERIEGEPPKNIPPEFLGAKVNFNKGSMGRGKRLLQPEHMDMLSRLLAVGPLASESVLRRYLLGGLQSISISVDELAVAKALPEVMKRTRVEFFPKELESGGRLRP